ncbi:MAG: hypothetical protein RR214_04555, partial [Synergistaceae bacterium]
MATINITEEATYDSGVKEIQVGEPVGGGPTAPANLQAKNLANRTKYLKQEQDSLKTKVGTLESKVGDKTLADALMKAQNLSDVPDKAAARQNLGVPATEHSHSAYLSKSSNLSDIDNVTTARNNIGALAAAEKGAANGVATLDANGKLLESQMSDPTWEQIPTANVTRTTGTSISIPGDIRAAYPKGKRLRL